MFLEPELRLIGLLLLPERIFSDPLRVLEVFSKTGLELNEVLEGLLYTSALVRLLPVAVTWLPLVPLTLRLLVELPLVKLLLPPRPVLAILVTALRCPKE